MYSWDFIVEGTNEMSGSRPTSYSFGSDFESLYSILLVKLEAIS